MGINSIQRGDMDRLKRLLHLLADGRNLSDAWGKAGYKSLREAKDALHRLADSICEGDTGAVADLSSSDLSEPHKPDESAGRLIVYADGASRGNPGPSAVAAVAFLPSGEQLTSTSKKIGRATNNIAEYKAVLEGLHLARTLKASEVSIRLDSELVVKQLNGVYRIKNKKLQSLAQAVIEEAASFRDCTYEHVPRSENKIADRMANDALDVSRDS